MADKNNMATVEETIQPVIEKLGYELADVEYVRKGQEMHLTVYIAIPRGISLDDCETVHNAIDPLLDELNPTGDTPYVLNVSSPGLDRPFKKQRDYERNYGKEVEVKLFAPLLGKKLYEGILLQKSENAVTIQTKDDEMKIEDTRISFVRPLVKFE